MLPVKKYAALEIIVACNTNYTDAVQFTATFYHVKKPTNQTEYPSLIASISHFLSSSVAVLVVFLPVNKFFIHLPVFEASSKGET